MNPARRQAIQHGPIILMALPKKSRSKPGGMSLSWGKWSTIQWRQMCCTHFRY